MKISLLIGLSALIVVANCAVVSLVPGSTTYFRTPYHDTAVIHSERANGNFAYSTVEGHAYQAITPINVVRPFDVRYALPSVSHHIIPQQVVPQQVYYNTHPHQWTYAFSPVIPQAGYPVIHPIDAAQDHTEIPSTEYPTETESAEIETSNDDSVSIESA